MAGKRKVANLTALAILSVLTHRPMHPYEMARALRGWSKDRDMQVKWGSLYSVVASMEKHALIEAAGTGREGNRPERTVYRITDAGRAEMVDWTRELLAAPEDPQRFRAGLSVMSVVGPDDAADLLGERIAGLEQRIAGLRRELDEGRGRLPRLFTVEGAHELALTEADLAWTRALRDEIASGAFPDLDAWREFHVDGTIPEAMADLARQSLDGPVP
ncbi:PadR family transcriptional regulator [Glycomyces harbinensis]|uniref:DNA-binding transcriptional regulator, PadR family n=1 Tax=Glycomyces harbinensis TaxID=58114 RepID=A0A1G7BXA0_9ACTN|nr:PadR family transcriptional regulator [Glycomyces harbinensis]SDE31663.1 DNA-binding transcriptional regulator, PadR family [Glycomyces harbinensis]